MDKRTFDLAELLLEKIRALKNAKTDLMETNAICASWIKRSIVSHLENSSLQELQKGALKRVKSNFDKMTKELVEKAIKMLDFEIAAYELEFKLLTPDTSSDDHQNPTQGKATVTEVLSLPLKYGESYKVKVKYTTPNDRNVFRGVITFTTYEEAFDIGVGSEVMT